MRNNLKLSNVKPFINEAIKTAVYEKYNVSLYINTHSFSFVNDNIIYRFSYHDIESEEIIFMGLSNKQYFEELNNVFYNQCEFIHDGIGNHTLFLVFKWK